MGRWVSSAIDLEFLLTHHLYFSLARPDCFVDAVAVRDQQETHV